MKKADINILKNEDVFDLIGSQWMLVTSGTASSFNMMTASWGGIGWLWNRPVAFIFIRPERYTHELIECNERLTLSFFPEENRKALQICGKLSGRDTDKVSASGLTPSPLESGAMTFSQARLVLDCRKLFKSDMKEADFLNRSIFERWYGPSNGLHTVYVAEIESVYTGD